MYLFNASKFLQLLTRVVTARTASHHYIISFLTHDSEATERPESIIMSAIPDPSLDSSTDALSDELQKPYNESNAVKWQNAMETVSRTVKDFLATRGQATLGGRGNIVFQNLSVEGSGKGVRYHTQCWFLEGAEAVGADASWRYRSNLRAICPGPCEPSQIPWQPPAFSSPTPKL